MMFKAKNLAVSHSVLIAVACACSVAFSNAAIGNDQTADKKAKDEAVKLESKKPSLVDSSKPATAENRISSATILAKKAPPSEVAPPKAISPKSILPTQISLESIGGKDQITIPTNSDSPKYTVERISSPERLVIDLEINEATNIRSAKQSGLMFVSAVRVGLHPKKVRVVIDLKSGGEITHEVRTQGRAIVVAVGGKAVASATPAATIKPTVVATPVEVAKPAVVTTNKVEVKPTQVAASVEVAKPPVVATNVVEAKQTLIVPEVKPTVLATPVEVAKLAVVATNKVEVKPTQVATSVEGAKPPVVATNVVEAKPTVIATPVEPAKSTVAVTNLVESKPTVISTPIEVAKPTVVATPAQVGMNQSTALTTDVDAPVLKTSVHALDSVVSNRGVYIANVTLEGNGLIAPLVAITLSGSPEFNMVRTAPSEYVLTLRNSKAAESVLKETLFTPRESSGIRSVRSVTQGSDTLFRIFTQPTSYLTARRLGDKLLVEETQDLAQVARDIRAQISPAATKPTPSKSDGAKDKGAEQVDKSLAATKKDKREDASELKPEGEKAPNRSDERMKAPSDGELAAMKGNAYSYSGRLISLDLQDADIDSALRIIAEVSNLNIVAGDGVSGKVTLKLVDVPWDQALEVILKSHGLDKILEGNVLRVAPVDKLKAERESFKEARVAEEELEPLSVKYTRVSYAKASEIKSLVETVLTERGSVAFDERSNQLVVKDVRKGLQNVAELIKKVDLRTPQILIETQIVEASRGLTRQLGSELGFQYIQSPATGNGTGLNFPAAIAVGGSADTTNPANILGSAFPVASSANLGSAVTMLFDSADGTKSLSLRLSQLEQEGQVRIVSKPAVATTNNKPAEIKSVEKIRVKLPNGGLSIASGSGAQSSGSGDVATQTLEAGIILNVTPQASPDYYILLDIKAKSSSFSAVKTEEIPNEIERSASSSVLVSSGQTFALGGIYKLRENNNVTGVPFFKDIPILGTFFRSMTSENADEELLFFITPRIVEGSFEDANIKVGSRRS